MYFVEQMKAYRTGKRVHPEMNVVARPLTDADIADLAAWYASIKVSASLGHRRSAFGPGCAKSRAARQQGIGNPRPRVEAAGTSCSRRDGMTRPHCRRGYLQESARHVSRSTRKTSTAASRPAARAGLAARPARSPPSPALQPPHRPASRSAICRGRCQRPGRLRAAVRHHAQRRHHRRCASACGDQAGGPNPATPGEHYTPLAAGTEVVIPPGATSATVNVDALGPLSATIGRCF